MSDASPILHAESCLDLRKRLIVASHGPDEDAYLHPFILLPQRGALGSGKHPIPIWLEISQEPGVHLFAGAKSPHQTLSEYLQLPYASISLGGKRYRTSLARAEDYDGGLLAFVALDAGYLWTIVPKDVV